MDSFLDAFIAQYFEPTVRAKLDNYFKEHDFSHHFSSETKVVYCKEDVYMNLCYWPEDYPNYYLMIGIGFIHRIGGRVTYEGAGLWYASPSDGLLQQAIKDFIK